MSQHTTTTETNDDLKTLVINLSEKLRQTKLQLALVLEELAKLKQRDRIVNEKFRGPEKVYDWIDKIYDRSKRP